jgi:hypothetical protein
MYARCLSGTKGGGSALVISGFAAIFCVAAIMNHETKVRKTHAAEASLLQLNIHTALHTGTSHVQISLAGSTATFPRSAVRSTLNTWQ